MNIYKYIVLMCFFVVVGCSGDDVDTAADKSASQSSEQTVKKTEDGGVLNHYVDSVNMAKEAKRLQEESDKKRKEIEQAM